MLRNGIRRDRVAHAYLFRGPDGVGKSTAARYFAQALTCLDPPREGEDLACGECRSCGLVARGNHPDVRVITAERDREGRTRAEISIHQIRQSSDQPYTTPRPLIQDAYLKPLLASRKVYLIDPAERMRAEAANALLKVLEEPPAYVVLVLVSSQPSALLPTIISRCQQVVFQLAGTQAIEEHLMELGVAPEAAVPVARLSGGRVGWAVRAARQPEILAARRSLLDLCSGLASQGMRSGLRLAEDIRRKAAELAEARPEAAEVEEEESSAIGEERLTGDRALRAELPWCLEVMVSWYRDRLAAASGAPIINEDYEAALRNGLASYGPREAETAIEALLEARQQIQRNANIDLALESLALRLLGGE